MSDAASGQDLSDLGTHTPESPSPAEIGWLLPMRRHTRSNYPFIGQRHLSVPAPTRSFITIGTAIAFVSLVWIAYGARKDSVDAGIVIAICATVLLVLLAWLTYLSIRSENYSVEASARVAQAGHIGSASNYLSAESPPSRLGALYVLEQIGIESRESAASVLNSLLNFIRDKTSIRSADPTLDETSNSGKVRDDVQTALAILGRLRTIGQLPLSLRIDLSWCNLSGARFEDWDFSGIDLHHAVLDGADLSNSNFDNANLPYCSFRGAHIVGVSFNWAVMYGADLSDSVVIGCNFSNAMLARAALVGAQVRSSRFDNAILSEARFTDADLVEVSLDNAAIAGLEGLRVTSEWTASETDGAAVK
jgi:uncharacterized protein YjbI with pentapeptide repeats